VLRLVLSALSSVCRYPEAAEALISAEVVTQVTALVMPGDMTANSALASAGLKLLLVIAGHQQLHPKLLAGGWGT
jgi:hypothetical protein